MALPPSKALFKQHNSQGTEDLDEWRKRFVAIADPTEYQGGIELCGSWNDWQAFKRNWPTFKNTILIELSSLNGLQKSRLNSAQRLYLTFVHKHLI